MKIANDAGEFVPEPRPISFEAGSFPGIADVLAWESPSDEVNLPVLRIGGREGLHVVMSPDVGPVLREDAASKGINLDLKFTGHSRPFESEIHAAASREE
jgi:hypothetical protein